jgi:hypothetical protein
MHRDGGRSGVDVLANDVRWLHGLWLQHGIDLNAKSLNARRLSPIAVSGLSITQDRPYVDARLNQNTCRPICRM